MKHLSIILFAVMALTISCKKDEKCLVGGKWYHMKTVIGTASTNSNGTWVEFNEDGYIYTSWGEKTKYTATDTKVNGYPYQCRGKKLKIYPGFLDKISYQDEALDDFDNVYIEYKR